MKDWLWCVTVAAAAWSVAGCADRPVPRVGVPSPNDHGAYIPQPMPKPMPGETAPAPSVPQQAAPAPAAPASPIVPAEPLPQPELPGATPGAGITPAPR